MKNIRIIIITLALLFGCHDRPLLIDISTERISIDLDKSIPTLMEESNVVGLSVVIIRKGKIPISKSFGYADIESRRIVDERTVYRAASLGKPIFAYIVVLLSQKGKIDLDLPLYSYLKEEIVNGDSRSRIITSRMVLTHTTGLPNLDKKKSNVKFLFDPGTNFKYSGHAFLYLQKVIEKITEKPLNKLADELVFQPLEMSESSFIWQNKYRGTISNSYNHSRKSFPLKEKPLKGYSAWSLFTTIEDYARFVSYIIKTSRVQNSIAKEMLEPYVNVAKGVVWKVSGIIL